MGVDVALRAVDSGQAPRQDGGLS